MSRVGVSTACFYPDCVYSALETIVSMKAPVTEIFMNSFSEMSTQNLRKIKNLADANSTKIISFHPFLSAAEHLFFFSGYKPRIDDGIEIYRRFFEAASFLGAKYFVFHGERLQGNQAGISALPCEQLLEVYDRLLRLSKEYDVVFSQESVTLFRSESVELIEFLAKSFDDIGFTLDVKQVLRSNGSISEMIQAMKGRIVQVHLNNFRCGKCVLPFDGDADMLKLKQELVESGYSGDYCIEVYRDNFSTADEIAIAMKKANELFAD